MNERQKKVTVDAFQMLAAGAQRGKRLVKDGATIPEVRKHLAEMKDMIARMDEALDRAKAAGGILEHVANKRGAA